jgi:hypothetical protein
MNATEALRIEHFPPPEIYRSRIRVADISIGLSASNPDDLLLSPEPALFLDRSDTDPAGCDIQIAIEWADQLQLWKGKKLFDSGSIWTIYGTDSGFVIDFVSPVFGLQPYKRLLVTKDFSNARLVLNRECLAGIERVYALEYPADELLVTNWLAQGRGVEVHGCGLIDGESGGHLFLGHSGAGKSTTTLLWKSVRNAEVLSDDRIILRKDANNLWMHGTPWHGDAGFALPEKASISRIFILEHGEANEIVPLTKSEAVAEMFARCFPPFHGREPLSSTLSYLEEIVNRVSCYRFRFRPEASAVETILNFKG